LIENSKLRTGAKRHEKEEVKKIFDLKQVFFTFLFLFC